MTAASTWPPITGFLRPAVRASTTCRSCCKARHPWRVFAEHQLLGRLRQRPSCAEDPLCATLQLPGDFSVNSVRADLDGDGLDDQAIAYSGAVNPGCSAFDCYYVDTYVAVNLQNSRGAGDKSGADAVSAAGWRIHHMGGGGRHRRRWPNRSCHRPEQWPVCPPAGRIAPRVVSWMPC